MNPYHADFDNMIDVKKLSYGDMLEHTQDMDATCLTRRTSSRLTAEEFEAVIKEDYKHTFTAAAKLLAAWWHMDHFLNQPDVLDYDYICLRQTDSYIDFWVTAESVRQEITEKNLKVLGRENERHQIPVVYKCNWCRLSDPRRTIWPSANFIPSYAYILNRSAVKLLQGRFYQLALNELNYYDKLLYPNELLLGKPGIAMLRIAVKHNIESVSLGPLIINPEQVRRGPPDANGNEQPPIDYSQLDRSGTIYTGQENQDK